MDDEVQQLRDLVGQLQADIDCLRQERAEAPDPSVTQSAPVPPPVSAEHRVFTDRFAFISRDRKCPMFGGRSGVSFEEWEDEVQACMRARHLSSADQAFFLFDHLEAGAKEEIKHRSAVERGDPERILAILRELYGCSYSHVLLQEAFFSRKQQDGEGLLEFSLALMSLMGKIQQAAPHAVPNAEVMLRDQFMEHVADCALRRELKRLVRCQPSMRLLDVRREALRWEREGTPFGGRGRSLSIPAAYGISYGLQGQSYSAPRVVAANREFLELKDLLTQQQEQINLLTRSVSLLQASKQVRHPHGPVICRRCQQPGHFARNCEGPRVSGPRDPPSSGSVSSLAQSGQQPGNEYPPRC
ncbi:uncharacterized protein LOC125717401 [Brienomyrus brachyistius]|uniref:uncharacterized protein LOC125717401 n=1 Tax=Brienomyrus brachyistius TaxID=42636 RepID=UPI0020B202AC|nr:uncharacterized protein LOC125717401 [Brienomyrus brachyistius]XP_048846251.1 uncharacterized protein LOC125717401 [Brienomyrus brachyistius]